MEKLKTMKEPIQWSHVVMVTRKSSPFMQSLNALIYALTEAGIVSFWESEMASKYQADCREDSIATEPYRLTVNEVQGIFIVFCISVSMSAILFIIELTAKKFDKR